MDTTQKEIKSRKEDIEAQLDDLFKTNMKITDWDVPEADDKIAAILIYEILKNRLEVIKTDIDNGVYDNY